MLSHAMQWVKMAARQGAEVRVARLFAVGCQRLLVEVERPS